MLTPRENFARFLKNEPYERIPTGLDCKYFAPTLISSNTARGFVLQQNPYNGPMGGKDLFGVEWVFDPRARGSMEKRPMLNSPEELKTWEEHIKFADLDALDWEGCAKENSEYLNTDKMLCTMLFSGFFERLISLVGFEDAAIALIDDEYEIAVHTLLQKM